MHDVTQRAIRDLMDDGRAPFAAKANTTEQLAFFVDQIHQVGLFDPMTGQINPQARELLIAKYGPGGYVQMLEALNAGRTKLLSDAPGG